MEALKLHQPIMKEEVLVFLSEILSVTVADGQMAMVAAQADQQLPPASTMMADSLRFIQQMVECLVGVDRPETSVEILQSTIRDVGIACHIFFSYAASDVPLFVSCADSCIAVLQNAARRAASEADLASKQQQQKAAAAAAADAAAGESPDDMFVHECARLAASEADLASKQQQQKAAVGESPDDMLAASEADLASKQQQQKAAAGESPNDMYVPGWRPPRLTWHPSSSRCRSWLAASEADLASKQQQQKAAAVADNMRAAVAEGLLPTTPALGRGPAGMATLAVPMNRASSRGYCARVDIIDGSAIISKSNTPSGEVHLRPLTAGPAETLARYFCSAAGSETKSRTSSRLSQPGEGWEGGQGGPAQGPDPTMGGGRNAALTRASGGSGGGGGVMAEDSFEARPVMQSTLQQFWIADVVQLLARPLTDVLLPAHANANAVHIKSPYDLGLPTAVARIIDVIIIKGLPRALESIFSFDLLFDELNGGAPTSHFGAPRGSAVVKISSAFSKLGSEDACNKETEREREKSQLWYRDVAKRDEDTLARVLFACHPQHALERQGAYLLRSMRKFMSASIQLARLNATSVTTLLAMAHTLLPLSGICAELAALQVGRE
eukprot:gene26902-4515_t